MVAPLIAVLDEGLDVGLKRTRQRVVSQQDPILQGLMPALALALGLRVIRRAANVLPIPVLEPVGPIAGAYERPSPERSPRPRAPTPTSR